MMHSMFPIIPLATDPGDLRPVESLALTTPLVVAIVACLLLAVGLIALIIMLSRPAHKPRNSDRARGAHSNASSKAEWRARIDDVVMNPEHCPGMRLSSNCPSSPVISPVPHQARSLVPVR